MSHSNGGYQSGAYRRKHRRPALTNETVSSVVLSAPSAAITEAAIAYLAMKIDPNGHGAWRRHGKFCLVSGDQVTRSEIGLAALIDLLVANCQPWSIGSEKTKPNPTSSSNE